jgi:hypothetical protein
MSCRRSKSKGVASASCKYIQLRQSDSRKPGYEAGSPTVSVKDVERVHHHD